MSNRFRFLEIPLAALSVLAISVWAAWPGKSSSATPSSGPRPLLPTANETRVAWQLDRDPLVDATSDPFRPMGFEVPPPTPVVPRETATQGLPPVKAVIPPFPYRYFGRMVDVQGHKTTYLIRDNTVVPIREHDVLDQVYRIDAIGDVQIGITYLPLGEQISLAVESAEK